MPKEKLKSEIIRDFLNLVLNCPRIHNAAYQAVGQEDKLTVDLLHAIEIDGDDRATRNKAATALRLNRLDRRYYKDIMEEYEPIHKFLQDPANEKAIKKLTQVLGDVRKVEKYHEDRTYRPRCNSMDNLVTKEVKCE